MHSNHNGTWKPVSRSRRCPACGGADRCGFGDDGAVSCFRASSAPAGYKLIKASNGATIFAPEGVKASPQRSHRTAKPAAPLVVVQWTAEADKCRRQITLEQVADLAARLGVTTAALDAVRVGWATRSDLDRWNAFGAGWSENPPDGAYSFPESDGGGRVVGLSLRAADGRKGAPHGAKRGVVIPSNIHEKPDPVLIVEGASDVAALTALGLTAVGRPSNSGGAVVVAALLDSRDVLIVGENDAKESGEWPGREGAKTVAKRIASERGEPVSIAMPPAGVKDARVWLNSRVEAGLDLADAEACRAVGSELLSALQAAARPVNPERKLNQSEMLVRMALERYTLGVTLDGESFAVENGGANIALMFRGSREALRATLARDFRRIYGITPKGASLADALAVLSGEALDCEPEEVHLRVAEHDGAIIIDLGRRDGQSVIVKPVGWEVVERSPVLFRRTALIGELPIPEHGGTVDELRDLLNVTEETWPLLLGWLVAAYFLGIPHAILLLGGEQGTGKTTAARLSMKCFDPGPAIVRSVPKDLEQWQVTACASWGVVLDNISHIAEWLSDALCRAVTGEGAPKRALYTNSEIAVIAFRRVIALTSIDAGALKGDFGERLILVDLERIDETKRRTEKELEELFAERWARILGALLDVVAGVSGYLGDLFLESYPRMADFARLLAAMDRAIGTDALDRYIAQGRRVADEVIQADPVGAAIVALVTAQKGSIEDTASNILAKIKPENASKEWPNSPHGMGRQLRRLAGPLRALGVVVVAPGPKDKSRLYRLYRAEGKCEESKAQNAQTPETGSGATENAESDAAFARAIGQSTNDSPDESPVNIDADASENTDSGDSGLLGDSSPALAAQESGGEEFI